MNRAAALHRPGWGAYLPWGLGGLVIWWLVYRSLAAGAAWFTYALLGLKPGSHLAAAVEFFVFESPKVLMLLALVVFAVGIIRSFFTPERTRRCAASRRISMCASTRRSTCADGRSPDPGSAVAKRAFEQQQELLASAASRWKARSALP